MKSRTLLFIAVFIIIPSQVYSWSGAERLYEQADKYYLQSNYHSALARCQDLLKTYKRTSLKDDARLLAGLSLLKLEKYAESRSYFTAVINQKPESELAESAYMGLADSYYLEKDYKKSDELYCAILSGFPSSDFSSIIDSRLEKMGRLGTGPCFYTVQIGSFKSKSNATRLYRKFKKAKYSVYLTEDKNGKTQLYKVRIGKFKSKEKAETFSGKLKKQGYETKVTAW